MVDYKKLGAARELFQAIRASQKELRAGEEARVFLNDPTVNTALEAVASALKTLRAKTLQASLKHGLVDTSPNSDADAESEEDSSFEIITKTSCEPTTCGSYGKGCSCA